MASALPQEPAWRVAVKGNAYSHGAVPVARAALAAGARALSVDSIGEAVELLGAGITGPCR
ncbi:MAG: alanine racemase [Gammaproteobacteria bacterium]